MSAGLSWRRFAGVLLLCTIVSTQVLFQPGLLDHWSPALVLRGWLEALAEALACGCGMWLVLTAAERAAPARGPTRHAVFCIAVLLGAATGYAITMISLQPPGFRPPPLNMAGDVLRWALIGAVVALAAAHVRRSAEAAAALAEAGLQRAELDKQMLEAQLQVLQAQIEPHFLFNTLAHVKRLYRLDPANGREMLGRLRQYLHAAIPHMRSHGSTLAEELTLVGAYLQMLGIRMGERLSFTIEVAPEASAREFPTMVLLTLVENAVKHGIGPRPEGGRIEISAAVRAERLEVEVADDGAGFSGGSGSGVGLANIRARLKGLHGESATLSLKPNRPRGVVAHVVVPA
ncbi:MAG TPA: histidine kinase [Usitatibacter sp.]|nr:histidine kinase [Usitatibacter sp.]